MSIDEFKQAVQNVCVGKAFTTFPTAFKSFIANQFKTVDVNGMFLKPTSNNLNSKRSKKKKFILRRTKHWTMFLFCCFFYIYIPL